MQWQPISTAPKSGYFLATAYDPDDGWPPECLELVIGPFLEDGRIFNANCGNYVGKNVFTHWMPLPKPPVEEAA